MWITCIEKKVNIKSITVQNIMVITFYAEEGGDNVQHNTEHDGDHLKVEECEDQVNFNPEHHDGHLHAEEGEDRVQLPPKISMWIIRMKKKAKFKSNSIQNVMMVTCMQKRVNIKSNSMQEAVVVTCMKREVVLIEISSSHNL